MSTADWTTTMNFTGKEGSLPKGTKISTANWTNQYLPQ
jgi:hypothetical protein